MTIKRSGSAYWKGGIKDGGGTVSTQSGVLKEAPYGFHARFENGPGTNPEELIGAAHAGCFTMALSGQLGQAGLTATALRTEATVALNKDGEGYAITDIHLNLVATVPGATQQQFDEIALKAKNGCPVSKLFNANITLSARLED
jgi:osmotically inducible protein OsmC